MGWGICSTPRLKPWLSSLSNNIAVVIGPPLGGYLVTGSYNWAFIVAAAGALFYGVAMIILG
jgi:MFS family permease